MASDGSALSADPSSTGTAAHFGQRAHDQARAGTGSGGAAAAPAVPEAGVADEVQVQDIVPAGPDPLQEVELAVLSADYAPQRTRSASSTRASPASQRSASSPRGRSGVGDVVTTPLHHVRAGTTPGGSPASRTTTGGAGPVSPHHRVPDPSQASLTRDGGGGPPLDPYGADPNTYRDGVQHRSPNPPIGDTPVTTGSSGSSLGPSASQRDELTEAAIVTTGTTSTPPMLPTPSRPPIIEQPIPVISTSTLSMSSWVEVAPAGGLAGGGDAPRTAEQCMELEIERMKRENENAPAEPVAKRNRSPATRSIGDVKLGVGVPLNPSAPPLPPPPVPDAQSYIEAIQIFDSGLSTATAPPRSSTAIQTSQPSAPKTSYEDMFKVLEATNKAKDEHIGVLMESKKDLETKTAASADAAAAASSHAAAVMVSAQQQAQASAAALSQAAAAEASARQQAQQVLTGHARTASELAAGERRVEELERRLEDQTQLGAHMN